MYARSTLAAVLLSGCTPDAEPGKPPMSSSSTTLVATCGANPRVAAVFDCTWSSPLPGAGHVETWLPEAPEAVRSTPAGPVGTAHEVAVLGLKAGRTYETRVVVEEGDQRWESAVTEYTAPEVPADFPLFELEASEPASSEIAGGYVLYAAAIMGAESFTAVGILDGDGDTVWWSPSGPSRLAIAPQFSRDGTSIWSLETDITWAEDVGTIRRIPLDGSEESATRALLGHHATWENTDGTLTWLGFVYETIDGKDWVSDALRTAPEGATDETVPTTEFSWFEGYPEDPWEAVPGDNPPAIGTGTEWTHSNSLMALDDDAFYVMSKLLDTVLKIDRETGAIAWQLGGRYSDFTHPDGTSVWRTVADNDLFSHAHMSQMWDGGMTVFDNGDYTGQQTRAVEYAFDEDALTVEEVWSFADPGGGWTGSMGDVRKLAGGNHLISWSQLGYMSEVTPDGVEVWKARMDRPGFVGRVTPLTDLYAPLDPVEDAL